MIKLYLMDDTAEGQSFDIESDTISVGRSSDNDIRIKDKSVSRRHLKIVKDGDKYLVTDLNSKNGSFIDGELLPPGVDFEVREGTPIVVGMSVICIGKACLEEVMPFLESLSEDTELFAQDRPLTSRKNMELIEKVSYVLMKSTDLNEILEKILDSILELLRRIDRGVIVLIDEETGEISDVVSRSKNGDDDTTKLYSRNIVERVVKEGRPMMMRDIMNDTDVDVSATMKLMNVRSVMCVPMVSKSRIRGVIYVDSINEPYGFRADDLSLLTALSSPAAVAIENALLYAGEEVGDQISDVGGQARNRSHRAENE
jgi:adenylate cyclase